jgi:hypothetical protein
MFRNDQIFWVFPTEKQFIHNKIKFSLYLRKFRVEQLQSHMYEEGLSSI